MDNSGSVVPSECEDGSNLYDADTDLACQIQADVQIRKVVKQPAASMQTHVLSLQEVDDGFISKWQVLDRNATEPNIFYQSWFLSAAFAHLHPEEKLEIFTIWSGEPLRSDLLGLMPLSAMLNYSRWPIPHAQNWVHPNCFLGTPLVLPGHEAAFWTALLKEMDSRADTNRFLHINGILADGPLLEALTHTAKETGRHADIVFSTERAMLADVSDADEYYSNAVRKKKRKEINRLRNRLSEQGELAVFDSSDARLTGADVEKWMEEFFALEHSGWKGRAKSALASHPDTKNFVLTAVRNAHRNGVLHLIDMRIDGQPIAMLINFIAKPGGFSFKTAFDEDYAKFSPGVLLQIENLGILQKHGIDWMDSCAAEGHPMIDSLWTARRQVVRVSVSLGGWKRRLYFQLIRLAERTIGHIKSLRKEGAS